MKLKMDSKIKVRLTEIGEELLRKASKNSQKLPKKDSDGFTELKLIELLTMFEDFKYLGEVNQPFSGDIIIIC